MRQKKPKNQQELHNRLAVRLTKQIIEGPMTTGGDYADVLVLLESIAVGVFLIGKELGYGEDKTIDEFVTQVKERVAHPKEPVRQEHKQ